MSWGKCRTFSFSIEKEIRKVDKDGYEDIIEISYKIKFIKFIKSFGAFIIKSSGNLAEGIHKTKCKDCNCFLEYKSINDSLIKCKCLFCNKSCSNKIDEKLKRCFKIHFSFLIMILINLFCC